MFLASVERLSLGLGDLREKDKAEKILRQLPKDLVTEALQRKSGEHGKKFLLGGLDGLTTVEVEELLVSLDIEVGKIVQASGGTEVMLRRWKDGQKLFSLDGRVLKLAKGTEIELGAQEVEAREPTVDDLVAVVEESLELKEKQELLCGAAAQLRVVLPRDEVQVSEVQVVTRNPAQSVAQSSGVQSGVPRTPAFCERCKREGHWASDCGEPKRCYTCQQTGHLVKDCP